MPIHDWTRVDAGIFHHFHHEWISEISRSINRGLTGTDYYALAEQIAGGLGPDVLTLQRPLTKGVTAAKSERIKPKSGRTGGTLTLAMAPPKVRFRITDPPKWYASKKKAVTIRHVSEHRVVAILEIVSPGNKDSRSAMASFVRKAQDLLQDLLAAGVHLSLVDLFPPTPRDPEGIHPLVWGDDDGDTFQFDPKKPLTCASYISGLGAQAFVEPVAVGDKLPDLSVFLTPEEYVSVPLEATYQAAFEAVPEFWRDELLNHSGG
jgi:Protein of unknown function (DUF4058)